MWVDIADTGEVSVDIADLPGYECEHVDVEPAGRSFKTPAGPETAEAIPGPARARQHRPERLHRPRE